MGALSYARQDQHSFLMGCNGFSVQYASFVLLRHLLFSLEIDVKFLADLLEFVVISHIAMVVGQIGNYLSQKSTGTV